MGRGGDATTDGPEALAKTGCQTRGTYNADDVRDHRSDGHTFVLRLWMEELTVTGVRPWRGHITHVLDEERRYVESIDEIAAFIARYLDEIETPRQSADDAE